jgi:hypothetical protein
MTLPVAEGQTNAVRAAYEELESCSPKASRRDPAGRLGVGDQRLGQRARARIPSSRSFSPALHQRTPTKARISSNSIRGTARAARSCA